MPKLNVITREGQTRSFDAEAGASIMQVLRANGVDELLALCGGCMSCATCHVYVDPAFAALLPAISTDESDLLDGSEHRKPSSRLACQLPFSEAMTGIVVTIAPEE